MNNEYDNEVFFSEYAKMSRSREGLSAAGEWSRLKLCFPPLQGKTVLDLGCGYGWHCMYAAEQGAARVLGQDWIYTEAGSPRYWPVDDYFITGERNTRFLGCNVVKG